MDGTGGETVYNGDKPTSEAEATKVEHGGCAIAIWQAQR